ncbi:PLP-dependent aminotransferase family protein [Brevibacterium album]|uniref:MocR-like pyridoxine biosynthesis transcription factor PdxR n=1 Tax=Brevibacterium album TaxID=417948 RepID=UPI0003F6DAEE|nr:PLP-dependent aminotransferase family protein [Brevibacterium album]
MSAALPLVLDRSAATPLSSQIAAGVRGLVSSGALGPDQAVPSTRALAAALRVSRGTVVAAYDQLISESYLVSRPGGTTRVHPEAGGLRRSSLTVHRGGTSPDAPVVDIPATQGPAGRGAGEAASAPALPRPADDEARIDLSPHRRTAPRMDDPSWREAWRSAATAPDGPDMTTRPRRTSSGAHMATEHRSSSVQGLPELRHAVAEHLRLMRSMPVDPAHLVITAGARDGLVLTLAALRESLAPVAVEEPGYPGLRRVLRRLEMPTLAAPTDAEGVITSQLPASADALLLTPNHLFPSGAAMPAPRRIEVLRLAAERGQLVIEDDFDSDYRHVGAPLPTLWDLAPESVVHLGTFTQVLTPEAAVGYVIAPPALVPALSEAREDLGSGASVIAQRAVARYLSSGGLRRSITRRRRELVRRRRQLLEALSEWDVEMVSGAHAVVRLADAEQAGAVAEACLAQGVRVGDLGGYWGVGVDGLASSAPMSPTAAFPIETSHGLVLNCADVSEEEVIAAARIVSRALSHSAC